MIAHRAGTPCAGELPGCVEQLRELEAEHLGVERARARGRVAEHGGLVGVERGLDDVPRADVAGNREALGAVDTGRSLVPRERGERSPPRARREAELVEQRPRCPHPLTSRACGAGPREDGRDPSRRRFVLVPADGRGEDESLDLVGARGGRSRLERAGDAPEDALRLAESERLAPRDSEDARRVDVARAKEPRDREPVERLRRDERMEGSRDDRHGRRRRPERVVKDNRLVGERAPQRKERALVA